MHRADGARRRRAFPGEAVIWYRDRATWRLIALRYAPWLAALSLAWELAQLPLYTLWTEATPAFKAYAVLHCTAGDVLIGTSALLLALLVVREWKWRQVAALTALAGAVYTAGSEAMNLTLLRWSYSELMPVVPLGGARIGLAPLAQWLVLPPLALWLTRRAS